MSHEADDNKPKAGPAKIAVGRSPAYPYISLERALEKAEMIRVAGAHRQAMPPETFYQLWKFGPLSSGARQTLAALNIFGLVDYIGRGDDRKVRLSDLAQRIVLDKQPHSREREAAIREAALTPAIHSELYEKYGQFLPANVVIQTFLERDRGFNEAAAKALIEEFRETMTFAGLDKPDSMPSEPSPSQGDDRAVVRAEGSFAREFMDSLTKPVASPHSGHPAGPAFEDFFRAFQHGGDARDGVREEKFALKEGDVVISFPDTLSATSVEDLAEYIAIFLKKARREAAAAAQPPTAGPTKEGNEQP